MTPEEIAATYAEATLSFTPIVSEPTDDNLTAICMVLLPILHRIDYHMNTPTVH